MSFDDDAEVGEGGAAVGLVKGLIKDEAWMDFDDTLSRLGHIVFEERY